MGEDKALMEGDKSRDGGELPIRENPAVRGKIS